MGLNSSIDYSSVKDNNTYYTNAGTSMTHIVNGMAGNVEAHSTWDDAGYCYETNCSTQVLPMTNVLNMQNYGFTKLTVVNSTAAKFTFIEGDAGAVGDEFWLLKPSSKNTTTPVTSGSSTTSATGSITGTTSTAVATGTAARVGAAKAAGLLAAVAYLL